MPAPESTADAQYVVGVVHHADWENLSLCLASVLRQTEQAGAVLVVDTGVDEARLTPVRNAFPRVTFDVRENLGWGAGVNRVLEWAQLTNPGAEFALLLNPDIVLDPNYAQVLIRTAQESPLIAVAGGKLLRPDRITIDSAGIRLPRHRRPSDRGSGKRDDRQYDQRESVFAVSGAAMLVRTEAMERICIFGETVDQDFFAYHDDTDLCWRAARFGQLVVYEPAAKALHERGWRRERRFSIEPRVRRHSFKNHYLQIVKNERATDLIANLPWLIVWEGLRLGFALLRDPVILLGYIDALRMLPSAWAKRREMSRRLRIAASDRRCKAAR